VDGISGLVWKPKSPLGTPSIPGVGSPRGILPREAHHALLEALCVGFFGPGKPNFPVEAGPASRHRAPLPSLVSLGATPRGREVERRTPPPPPGSPPGVPAAISSFASGDSPLPVPLHLLAPMLGFLLSSPHTFSCRSCKKLRSREPTAAVRDPTSSSGATSSVCTHSSASPPARTCT